MMFAIQIYDIGRSYNISVSQTYLFFSIGMSNSSKTKIQNNKIKISITFFLSVGFYLSIFLYSYMLYSD